MKRYKSTKAIIRHAREFLSDPDNYAVGTLAVCVRPEKEYEWDSDNGELTYTGKWLKPPDTPLASLETLSEHCACCILGALREHTDPSLFPDRDTNVFEGGVLKTPAGRLVEETAQELYPPPLDERDHYKIDSPEAVSRAVDVNDVGVHKTAQGAYKATLRILDKALEAA